VICLVFTIKTFVRNYAWKNNESLFLTDITHSPNSARMNKSAGDIYMNWAIKQTDTEKKNHFAREALTYLHKAQRIYPDYADNLLDLGTAYFYLDEFDSTQYYWNRFKQLEPKSFHNSENKKFLINGLSILGIKLQKQGQIKESEAEFEKVIQLDSMDAPAIFNIGMLNATLLNYPKAVEYMEKAVAIDSLNAEYWYNYGGLAFTIKNYGLARSAWLKTLQINPQHSQAKQGLNAIKKYQ
jgi:tetratricopeptide (TPR) repeat protein